MNNIKSLLSRLCVFGMFLASASALASKPTFPPKPCPTPESLDIVMVGNEDMKHKSLTFPDGSKWDINYTYNIHGSTDIWGVPGKAQVLAPGRKPTVEFVDQEEWELAGYEVKTKREAWHSGCNYEVFKPAQTAESLEINDPHWRFSLIQQKIAD